MKTFIARTEADLAVAYEKLSQSIHVGCDTETSSLSAQSGKLFSVQFSDGGFNVLVPISEGVHPGPLLDLLADDRVTKIFHNAKFDLEFLRAQSFKVENTFCTMIAERILIRGARQSASLAETLYRHFGIDLDKSLRKQFTKSWDGVWTEELVHYALSDVVYLPELMKKQLEWLENLGLLTDFEAQMTLIRDR